MFGRLDNIRRYGVGNHHYYALGCITGIPLILYGGLEMVMVGIACVVFVFSTPHYSATMV